MSNPAVWTSPKPYMQWKFIQKVVTSRRWAKLAWRKPAISNVRSLSLTCWFVSDLSPKLAKTHIRNGLRKSSIFHHALDIEVFNPNDWVILNNSMAGLMCSIRLNILHPKVGMRWESFKVPSTSHRLRVVTETPMKKAAWPTERYILNPAQPLLWRYLYKLSSFVNELFEQLEPYLFWILED